MKLDNPKDRESIQEVLRQGQQTEFWHILTQALDDSIEHIQSELDGDGITGLAPDKYKVMAEILKGRKKDLKKLKELPEILIVYLENPDQTAPDFDPYEKPTDTNSDL